MLMLNAEYPDAVCRCAGGQQAVLPALVSILLPIPFLKKLRHRNLTMSFITLLLNVKPGRQLDKGASQGTLTPQPAGSHGVAEQPVPLLRGWARQGEQGAGPGRRGYVDPAELCGQI